MWGLRLKTLLLAASLLSTQALADLTPDVSSKCKGYTASNVQKFHSGLAADLKLIGEGCGIYGKDIPSLKLEVNYDTSGYPKFRCWRINLLTINRGAPAR
jgi:alpha-glucosidase